MKIKFDDPTIRNLKPGKSPYYDCLAIGEPGFGLRVFPTGGKSFFHQYKVDGEKHFMTFGSYPEMSLKLARELYQANITQIRALRRGSADGVNPVAEKKRKKEQRIAEEAARSRALSVEELCTDYIEKHAKAFKRSWKEDERILQREVIPLLGKRKAQDLIKRDVIVLLEGIIDRGSPGMANNTFKIIRKMLNYAVEKDILPYSCATGVKLPAPLNSKERVLTQEEIKQFWNNLDDVAMTDDVKAALKLILLTAQRPGEVVGMHTNDIDENWWTIPADRQEQDGKGRAKNKKSHRVYLTETVQDIIAEQIDRVKSSRDIPSETAYSGYIFPSRHKKKVQSVDRHAVSRAVARNIAFPLTDTKGRPLYQKNGQPATVNKLEVDDFTPHDLRRTAATFMAQAGEMDEVIDAVLNHAKQGVIKVYNQYRYDAEKQKALETWERKLLSIINGKPTGKVLPINRRVAQDS